jgi:tRNA U34 5-methylaminomethyl-2-thiouridine-forming methyltransferase MnmC
MHEIIETNDGSHSIKSLQFGESFHSKHGAIQESKTVFIDAALRFGAARNNSLRLLEMGFGTGLNALMTLMEAEQNKTLELDYLGIEAYPVEMTTAKQLNYTRLLDAINLQTPFLEMHASENERLQLSENFSFQKRVAQFESIILPDNYFDIIYYDAFAPAAQPALWETPMLSKMYKSLRIGGVLTTYCAKGSVKRCLKSIGFEIEGLAGPIGKREITRATKK